MVLIKTILYAGVFLFMTLPAAPAVVAQDNNMTFRGYPCGANCSRHISGFEWARRTNVTSYSECTGSTPAHIEGCFAWVDALHDDHNPRILNTEPGQSRQPSISPEHRKSR